MDEVTSRVARQYEAYAYPEPFADIAAEIAKGYVQWGDPSRYGPMIWPEGRPREQLRILAAGCGTVQAAHLAFTNPNCTIVGVDISEASLAHERFLKERHGLSNLRLFQGDLRDVGQIGETFDFIVCSGVLHHMADPDEGLRALARVLDPAGAMLLALYGATRRTGVYLMQDVFRRLGVTQDAEGVAFARDVIAALPRTHFVHWYARAAKELEHDAAFVDTFLHPQDRAYTVPQILDMTARCGLSFQAWIDNAYYYADSLPAERAALKARLAALADEDQWAAVESLTLIVGMHIFLARPASSPRARWRIDPGAPDWDLHRPFWAPNLSQTRPAQGGASAAFARSAHTLELAPAQALALNAADGARTIREILALGAFAQFPAEARAEFGRAFFANMWRLGHVMFALPPRGSD